MDNNTNNNNNNNNNARNSDNPGPKASSGNPAPNGGIKEFIAQTTMIGNVIAAAASQKNSSEPLPFTDYSLFEETYDINRLALNINPQSNQKYIFLPGTPISVSIKAERKHGSHIFHPYLYTIDFTHGEFKWSVCRSYKDIKEVHKTLSKIVKADLGRSCSDIAKADIKSDWPEFPTEHDHLVSAQQIDDRCKKLAEYLRRLLTYPPYRDNEVVLHFLGVSPISFVKGLSGSLIEDTLQKRIGDNIYYLTFNEHRICCERLKLCTTKRWFVLKDTYLAYLNTEQNNLVGFVMLSDRGFKVKKGMKAGAYHGIEITNLQRSLVLKCRSTQQQIEWFEKINAMLNGTGNMFHNANLLSYESYAPPRPKQKCRWFCNAEAYMENVMHGLNNAKEEIFITDWWMCPELFLIRPTDDLQYRFDKILLKKAKEGVKIYIMLFKEIEFVVNLMSMRTKNLLTQSGKNPNIKVLRHPEHSPAGVMLWSHHEKLVIIDQSVAFGGGIDLCYGRWDDDLHRLIDLGRRENIVDIPEPEPQGLTLKALASQLRPDSAKIFNKELDHLTNLAEVAEHSQVNLEVNSQLTTESTGEANSLRATLTSSSPDPDQRASIQTSKQNNNKLRSDALIVAAFLGNSSGFSSNINSIIKEKRNTKLNNQMSSPQQLTVSPAFQGDSLSSRSLSMSTNETRSKLKDQKRASNMEMSTINSNASPGAVINTTTPLDANNNTNSSKNNLRVAAGPSRASKHLSVPNENYDGANFAVDVNDGAMSKKQIVKKKWNQIKRTVQNPLRRSGRRRSVDSNFGPDYYEDADSGDDVGADNEAWQRDNLEGEVELPIISNEGYYWNGKDYSNAFIEDFKDIEDFSSDQFDRTEVPRMPWRDEAFVCFGHSARDIARHFIQRWNQVKREKVKQNAMFPFLLPKGYTEPFEYDSSWFTDPLYSCNIQFTRSMDTWSGGISQTETSILHAYVDLIKNAEHYIYIENQFFVTTTNPEKDMEVKNPIARAICERIVRAHSKNEKFRAYVVLPLLPSFDSFNTIQAVQYYNLRSIINGEYSIYKELQRNGIEDPAEYITFHGMRNWSVLMGKLVHGIIYVHSKLLIVDDKYVICGSANINDRSMLGSRDSEIAAVIKDEEFISSTLNNKTVKVGKYAYSLRQKIFKLHLGIYYNNPDSIDLSDCVSDLTYNMFKSVSKNNTLIYDEVFKCLPTDNVLVFKDLENYVDSPCLNQENQKLGKERLEEVKGFVVDFPLLFLSEEKNFYPSINTKEGIVPIIMWT